MINEVYNTVLAVLNKNNYGYLSPGDFNLFAKQAQLDVFEDFFYSYNYQLNKENARVSGTGYADIRKSIEEDISIFSAFQFLNQPVASLDTANIYSVPIDYYFIDKIFYYPTQLFNGTTTAQQGFKLINAAGGFTANSISPSPPIGSIVVNTSPAGAPAAPMLQAYVTAVDSDTTLSLSEDIMANGQNYRIYDANNITQVEKVEQNKIFNLTSSNLTAPTTQFPAYVLGERSGSQQVTAYPSTINQKGALACQYIRYPLDPRWTYTMVNNTPLFNGGAADYQNFEVPQDNMNELIMRILKYAGVQIREADVATFAMNEIAADKQSEQ
tara:strand:- start:1205 stop:2185 length:981 start_codon:yes stop_codon:yes gene_type:complete